MTGSSGWDSSFGKEVTIFGGGVVNVQETVSASTPPTADWVPAGTVIRYSVALGSRSIRSRIVFKGKGFGAQPAPGTLQGRLNLHRYLLSRQVSQRAQRHHGLVESDIDEWRDGNFPLGRITHHLQRTSFTSIDWRILLWRLVGRWRLWSHPCAVVGSALAPG